MPRTLAILTDRFAPAVKVDTPCHVAAIRHLAYEEPLPEVYAEYYNGRYNCVHYRDYPYDYFEGEISPDHQPPCIKYLRYLLYFNNCIA
jgi:hypothetical protein